MRPSNGDPGYRQVSVHWVTDARALRAGGGEWLAGVGAGQCALSPLEQLRQDSSSHDFWGGFARPKNLQYALIQAWCCAMSEESGEGEETSQVRDRV